MRYAILLICAAIGIGMTDLALADDKAPPAVPPAAAEQTHNPDDELICKRATMIGTRLPGPKICKTRKIWREQQQNSKDLLDNATSKSLETGKPGG